MPATFSRHLDIAKALHPDFEVRVWNAADVRSIDSSFLREALEEKKWAFATDIVRLFAMEQFGGVYFDLDVKFNQPVTPWLNRRCVMGWESDYLLGPHLILSEPGHPFITEALKACRNRHLQIDNETLDLTPLPTLMTWLGRGHGLVLDGSRQLLDNDLLIEPVGVFTLDLMDGQSCCQHLYAGSWLDTQGSFSHELLYRYASTQRASAQLFRAMTKVLPLTSRKYVFDVLNSRRAFPGAYEATGYMNWKGGRLRKVALLFGIVARLNQYSPFVSRSSHHVAHRRNHSPKPARALYLQWAPTVDVIVPIYNVDKYLDRCLHSLQTQSYARLRVLLVDDGSLDGSTQIAQQYAERHSNFHYLHKDNGGLGSARNFGIDRIESDLVTFVDSDDWVEPDFVSSLVDALGPNGKIAVTNYDLVTPEGRVQQRFDLAVRNEGDPVKQVLSSGLESSAWNKIYRSDMFAPGVRFGDGWFEDFAVVPALLASCPTIGFVPGHKYHYLQRPDSILAQSRTNLPSTMNIFNSYEELKKRRHIFLYDRWDHYYQWSVARHLFIDRAYNIHSDPVDSRRRAMIRNFAETLNSAMPDWYQTPVVKHWQRDPRRLRERIARQLVIDSYKSGRANLYSTLQAIRRTGV